MTHRADVARGRGIVARWYVIAERRLEYLTELSETGRWRRFHSEFALLENLREAKAAVEAWHDLLTREASRDEMAVDISWLGRTEVALSVAERLRDQVHKIQPQPAETAAEPLSSDVSISVETGHVLSDEAASAPAMANPSELVANIDAMAERYPLLRNAL
jgi:uncharacterized repeat protein (TIGR03809 family)